MKSKNHDLYICKQRIYTTYYLIYIIHRLSSKNTADAIDHQAVWSSIANVKFVTAMLCAREIANDLASISATCQNTQLVPYQIADYITDGIAKFKQISEILLQARVK